MTMTRPPRQVKRLDLFSAALTLIGALSGVLAYALITHDGYNPLILIPAVAAATLGLSGLIKREVR